MRAREQWRYCAGLRSSIGEAVATATLSRAPSGRGFATKIVLVANHRLRQRGENIERGRQAGFDSCLVKPVDPSVLNELITSV